MQLHMQFKGQGEWPDKTDVINTLSFNMHETWYEIAIN